MDISKISRELNWRPNRKLDEGLRDTVLWYIHHSEWVDAIQKQTTYQSWIDKNYTQR
jgi:dTDP-glucose 4,6-dehydratase